MTGASVLATSPQTLRDAARQLRGLGEELRASAGELGALGGHEQGGWSGLAALEQRSRVESTQRLVQLAAGPGEEAACALERCATVAEDSASTVRSCGARARDALVELQRLRTLTVPDVLDQQAWQQRRTELERTITTCEAAAAQAEEEFDRVQRLAAQAVREAWDQVEGHLHLVTLGQAGQKLGSAFGRLKQMAVLGSGAWAMRRAITVAPDVRRSIATARARGTVSKLRANAAELPLKKITGKLPKKVQDAMRLAGPAGQVLTWYSAFGDLRDGGGYDGWRGGITRGLGAGALVAVPVAALATAPVAVMGASFVVAGYSLWSTGNWLYDNRREIGRGLRTAAGAVGRGIQVSNRVMTRARDRAIRATVRGAVATGWAGLGVARDVKRAVTTGVKARTKDMVTLGGRAGEFARSTGRGLGERLGRLRPSLPRIEGPRLPVQLGGPWGTGGVPGLGVVVP